ncbi:hypothetical protein AOE01nite_08190 [Acetobacter oeni]|uniref:Uncharacterized protein n=1 Tax=Acetobacter oeni TaxID=304077 RepID=A0A511XI24_9PROT|nr:hypothetical protein AOE01nite_08190 [Acetobacter oeni]
MDAQSVTDTKESRAEMHGLPCRDGYDAYNRALNGMAAKSCAQLRSACCAPGPYQTRSQCAALNE